MCIGLLPTCMYMYLVCAMPWGQKRVLEPGELKLAVMWVLGAEPRRFAKVPSALEQGASCPSLFVVCCYFFYYEGLHSCLTMGPGTLHMLGKHFPVELCSQTSSCR